MKPPDWLARKHRKEPSEQHWGDPPTKYTNKIKRKKSIFRNHTEKISFQKVL